MAQYRDGTVDVTNSSQTIIGNSTLWSTNVSVGDIFRKTGDATTYLVGDVVGDEQITLNASYAGTTSTASGYQVTRDFTDTLDLPLIYPGDLGTDVQWRDAMQKIADATLGSFSSIDVDTINERTSSAGVTIDGVLLKDGGITATGGGVIVNGGSASSPAVGFEFDTNTGFYRPANNLFAIVTGGGKRLEVSNTGTDFQGNSLTGVGELTLSGSSIHRNSTTSSLTLAGGEDATDGGAIVVYGSANATSAGDILLRSGANARLRWDESEEEWDFQGNDITTTGSVILGNIADYDLQFVSATGDMVKFDRTVHANIDTVFHINVSTDGAASTDFISFGPDTNSLRVYGDGNVKAVNDLEVGGTVKADGMFSLGSPTEKTISSGAITIEKSFHTVDTEADASTDDLDTINGGNESGEVLLLQTVTGSRVVTVKDGTGNIHLDGDFDLSARKDKLWLVYDALLSEWHEISRSNNA